jgi:hypothetical protein
MLKRLSLYAVLFVVCVHSQAFGHGGGSHLMGTVTAKTDQQLTIKTRKGQTVSIQVNKETMYRGGMKTATGSDVKVGDRIAVEATKDGDTFTATEIRFSPGGDAKSPQAMPHHEMGKGGEK